MAEESVGILSGTDNHSNRKKKCILFTTLVGSIIVVGAVIGIVVGVLISRSSGSTDNGDNDNKYLFDFEDIFNSSFNPSSLNVQWLNDSSFAYIDPKTNNIVQFEASTGQSSIFVNRSLITEYLGNTEVYFTYYTISPNYQFVLIALNPRQVWRHSFLASYLIYDVINGSIMNLTSVNSSSVQNVQWSPSVSESILVFVRSNNIFLKSVFPEMPEVQLTNNGESGLILNGIASWVYEEEILSDYNTIFWSKSGNQFAFMSMNESLIPYFDITEYDFNPYDNQLLIRYPKAGYPNPIVSIGIYDLSANSTEWVNLSNFSFEYITLARWMDNDSMYIYLMNRNQTFQQTILLNSTSMSTTLLWTLNGSAWIDTHPPVLLGYSPIEEAQFFVDIEPNNGFNSICKRSAINGSLIGFLTQGDGWEVDEIVAYHSQSNRIFYFSDESSSIQRQLYSISAENGSERINWTPPGAGWATASFSPQASFFSLQYSSSTTVPIQILLSTTNAEYSYVLESNDQLALLLSQFNMPTKKFYSIPVEGVAGEDMNAFMIFPPNFDESKKYPVLFNVYGGPGSQLVMDSFYQNGFHMYVASQLNMIVISVDGRGTAGKGIQFEQQVVMHLGDYETIDQINGAQYLANNYPFLDSNNFGIWGWSFGGYESLMVLSSYNNTIFQYAVSVAPVTDWRFYDTFYTEKYMKLPSENSAGYNESSVLNDRIKNIKDNTLLLIH